MYTYIMYVFFFQAEDGIRDLVRSRGLGDVYKRQVNNSSNIYLVGLMGAGKTTIGRQLARRLGWRFHDCLLYTSDAADERSSVDLGGRRIIKKKKQNTDKKGQTTAQ